MLKRVYNKTFWLWIVIISVGLLAQMFRRSDIDRAELQIIDNIELGVTFILALEICLRFLCDWRSFHRSRRNWVDLTLVIITLVMQIPTIHNNERMYAWLTIFQIVRVYRVVWAMPVTRHLLVSSLFPIGEVKLTVNVRPKFSVMCQVCST